MVSGTQPILSPKSSCIHIYTTYIYISLQRGVRQGDNMSRKLFTACLESVFRTLNNNGFKLMLNISITLDLQMTYYHTD